MNSGGAIQIAGAAGIVFVLGIAAHIAHPAEDYAAALTVAALLLVTYAAGLGLGWLGCRRKGARR